MNNANPVRNCFKITELILSEGMIDQTDSFQFIEQSNFSNLLNQFRICSMYGISDKNSKVDLNLVCSRSNPDVLLSGGFYSINFSILFWQIFLIWWTFCFIDICLAQYKFQNYTSNVSYFYFIRSFFLSTRFAEPTTAKDFRRDCYLLFPTDS